MSDERLGREDLGQTRNDRTMQDREVTSDRELTDKERLEMFRKENFQSALPTVPRVDGYHFCWLSTTSQTDTVERRMRLGYTPVRAEDLPGYNHNLLPSGAYEGCIGVNEMVLFKLPERLYRSYMEINHHEKPRDEEEVITGKLDEMKDRAEEAKARLEEDDGFLEMRNRVNAPRQW